MLKIITKFFHQLRSGHNKAEELEQFLAQFEARLEKIEARLEKIESRLEVLDLEVDRGQVCAHLRSLNYNVRKGKVRLCFCYHRDDKRKDNHKGYTLPNLNWGQIDRHQSKCLNVYVLVNGEDANGYTSSKINKLTAIFCEWDDITIEQQWSRLNQLKELGESKGVDFPQPTFIVYSGGRSLHCYWVFEKPILIGQDKNGGLDDWKKLQKTLVEVTKADKQNIDNPEKCLRLAGTWYISPHGRPRQVSLVDKEELAAKVNGWRLGRKYDRRKLSACLEAFLPETM